MHDMLAAFHLVRYFELLEKERQPCREFTREPRFSLALWLSRRRQPTQCANRDAL